MNFRLPPSVEAQLLARGPGAFYALASVKHQAAIVHGQDEIVVTIGTERLITVPDGLGSLDKYDKSRYDPSLVKTIASQHLVLATVPFDPGMPFAMIVPKIAVQFTSEKKIAITTASGNNDKTQELLVEILELPLPDTNFPHRSTFRHIENDQDFEKRVKRALYEINNSEITKVVLAKTAAIESTTPLIPSQLYLQMAAKYPSSYLFVIGNWVGASPELVISRNGSTLVSNPLAGTAPFTDASRLLVSHKDNAEHQIVVTQIVNRLSKLKIDITKQLTPTITSYGRIVHLASKIRGTLSPPLRLTSIEMAARIAPTAAICGAPFEMALSYIKNEEFPDREFFGGLVGYQKFQGDGSWVLNIRALELDAKGATLRAGVGIISESDPKQENAEANSKISSIIDGITPHNPN